MYFDKFLLISLHILQSDLQVSENPKLGLLFYCPVIVQYYHSDNSTISGNANSNINNTD